MAVSADSTSPDAWFNLADWHQRFGDKQLSMDDYLLVEELSTDPDLVRAAHERRGNTLKQASPDKTADGKNAPVALAKEVK